MKVYMVATDEPLHSRMMDAGVMDEHGNPVRLALYAREEDALAAARQYAKETLDEAWVVEIEVRESHLG